jgi:putative ABC transport system substrate-binding protein
MVHMKRREFITLVGGAAASWPLAAGAQQPDRMLRIGAVIGAGDDAPRRAWMMGFRRKLQELGWVEDRRAMERRRHRKDSGERGGTGERET